MPTQTLTDARCKSAKPGPKPIKLFDGHGMFLAVLPSGAKTWRVAYRLKLKPKTISLGPYPAVSLADARRKCQEVKATLRDGGDPMAPRKAQRGGMTFAEACAQYWAGRDDLSPSYRELGRRGLEIHLMPTLGALPVGSIDRPRLLAALKPMDAAKLYKMVRKVRMWAGQVFEWSMEQGECEANPAASINPVKAFGNAPVTHFASLELADMPALMQRIALEGELQSVLAFRLLALTWVRTNELRFMRWAEIDADMWRIPAGKMKRKRDHMVPLSPPALAVLRILKARARGEYVFPAEHRTDRPISENTVLALLARMGYKGKMTGHGLRSVASTWANERGYPPDAIERQLAHVPGDKTRAAYNRAEFIDQRRAMLAAWAEWLAEIEAG